MTPESKGSLPFMKTMDDAVEISRRENDNFYVSAFMLECWLGELTCRTVAEYAEKKRANTRRLQTGLAVDLFEGIFGRVSDEDLSHVFSSFLRFAEYDDAQSRQLRQAFWAMSHECPVSSWPAITPPIHSRQVKEVVAFMRAMIRRICEWVEAVTHSQMHFMSHHTPVAFDSDPEKREPAILGVQQRHFPGMSDFQKSWWAWHHGEAADRLRDPSNWSMLARGLTEERTTLQNYPALDETIILCWPLMLRHHWTYRDLMNVLQSVTPSPLSYPCQREQDLAAYCPNVLGLRKRGPKGRTTKNGLPAGADIAQALCDRSGSS